jgi:tetratricopeptide (TPR) repeat protein
MTARLAQALDHAFTRGVAHGDVKPSNILLAADGTPMLLDFNLALDWSMSDESRPLADPGGTLAYMAPERLRAIALASRVPLPSDDERVRLVSDAPAVATDPHSADLYALGMVLLEALTGRCPPPAGRDQPTLAEARGPLRDLAADYASSRERGALEIIRTCEGSNPRRIPPALRAILGRCLASQPSCRYLRGRELAEDLDRWRSEQRLAYANEPFWTLTLPRWVRTKRKVLRTAGLVALAIIVTTAIVMVKSQSTLQNLAVQKLARHWDDPQANVFHLQRPGLIRPEDPEDPRVLATAVSALKDYDVFANENWRQSDDIQTLPASDRIDLELWLLEQSFRYCRALEKRSGALGEWPSALRVLDHVNVPCDFQVFDRLHDRLVDRLRNSGSLESRPRGADASSPGREARSRDTGLQGISPQWMESYLLGLESELSDRTEAGRASSPGSRTALEHYQKALTGRPNSLWAHYRAAVVCFRLSLWSEAVIHLEECRRRRPNNAMILALLAPCLRELGRLDDALEACNRALQLAPGHAEFYRSRAFIRVEKGQSQELASDLQQFETLRRALPRNILRDPRLQTVSDDGQSGVVTLQQALQVVDDQDSSSKAGGRLGHLDDLDADDLEVRAFLAETIQKTGDTALAAAEIDKVLELDPNNLRARATRMVLELDNGERQEARSDLNLVLNHPDLDDFLLVDSVESGFFINAARKFASRQLVDDALQIADKLLTRRIDLGQYRGRFHYTKAVVHGVGGRSDLTHLELAARQLKFAFMANARYKEWYQRDPLFDAVRVQLDALIEELLDPPTPF